MSELKSRREILRKTAYVVPTVLTLAAKPSFASSGSGQCERNEDEWEKRGRDKKSMVTLGMSVRQRRRKRMARSTEPGSR